MFQNFSETGDSSQSAERVEALRRRLRELGVDGFVVPRADRHQNEYIPASEDRLRWLTGFTGSAGTAIVLPERAAVLSDGRYTIQLREQLDMAVFEPVSSVETSLKDYVGRHGKGLTIGIDPWLTTISGAARLRTAIESEAGTLVTLDENPLDGLWTDRPIPSISAIEAQPIEFSGRLAEAKIAEIADAVGKAGCDLAVLTDPASVSWLFNIRGRDVEHTPLVVSFAVVFANGEATLFVDPAKLEGEVGESLHALVRIEPYEDFAERLRELAAGKTVGLDEDLTAKAILEIVEQAGGTHSPFADPAKLPRARKNEQELAGSRAAHRRDGAAIVSFLAWLDRQAPGTVGEIAAAEALEAARSKFGDADGQPLRDISFDTIAGSGPHGAIVHYRVNRESERMLRAGELFLLDSGGQYRDGTTDITRTVPIGEASQEARRMFTLVLKGMIAMSLARFPKGTRGVDLDVLARIALWKAGADYAHGTGHGVGSFLAVHEGPQTISHRGMVAFEPGMIVSNEPGYYREGEFGIRIENLLAVEGASPIEGGDIAMLGFETLTLCPIDRRLVDPSLLTAEEAAWLNAYHERVRDELSPLIAESDAAWLKAATEPLTAKPA